MAAATKKPRFYMYHSLPPVVQHLQLYQGQVFPLRGAVPLSPLNMPVQWLKLHANVLTNVGG